MRFEDLLVLSPVGCPFLDGGSVLSNLSFVSGRAILTARDNFKLFNKNPKLFHLTMAVTTAIVKLRDPYAYSSPVWERLIKQ